MSEAVDQQEAVTPDIIDAFHETILTTHRMEVGTPSNKILGDRKMLVCNAAKSGGILVETVY